MRKNTLAIVFLLISSTLSAADSLEIVVNKIIDYHAALTDEVLDGEHLYDQLKTHWETPLNLNTATREELEELVFLSDFQIENILYYRYRYKSFLSKYELMGVYGIERYMLLLLSNFITTQNTSSTLRRTKNYFEHDLLQRIGTSVPQKAGFSSDNGFLGRAEHVLTKYKGNYGDRLAWSFVGESDPGEYRFSHKSSYDFLSASVEYNTPNKLFKKVIFGDFHLRLGQGLVSYTGSAFTNPFTAGGLRKRSKTISMYRSSLESGFNRGVATTLSHKNVECNLWFSSVLNDATLHGDTSFQSFNHAGYHRTDAEIEKKNTVRLNNAGIHLKWRYSKGYMGATYSQTALSQHFVKPSDPWYEPLPQLKQLQHTSIDFLHHIRPVYLWGELASNLLFKDDFAGILGVDIMASDVFLTSISYRYYSRAYVSFVANALQNSTEARNDESFVGSFKWNVASGTFLKGGVSLFQSPWLAYQNHMLSNKTSYLLRLEHNLKSYQLALQLKSEHKSEEQANDNHLYQRGYINKQNLRLELKSQPTDQLSFKSRFEQVWFKNTVSEKGYLILQDVSYTFLNPDISFNVRLAYFDTDGYNSRIYTYENDVLYAFSIPAFYDNGIRTYINLKYKPSRHLQFWLKASRTHYFQKHGIGSGLNFVDSSFLNTLRLQARIRF